MSDLATVFHVSDDIAEALFREETLQSEIDVLWDYFCASIDFMSACENGDTPRAKALSERLKDKAEIVLNRIWEQE